MREISRDNLRRDILLDSHTVTSNQNSLQNTDNSYSKSKQPYKQQPRCYVCNSPNHLARDCKVQKTESEGKSSLSKKKRVVHGSNCSGVEASSPEKASINRLLKYCSIKFSHIFNCGSGHLSRQRG